MCSVPTIFVLNDCTHFRGMYESVTFNVVENEGGWGRGGECIKMGNSSDDDTAMNNEGADCVCCKFASLSSSLYHPNRKIHPHVDERDPMCLSLKTLRRRNVTLRHAREDGNQGTIGYAKNTDRFTRKVYHILFRYSVIPYASTLSDHPLHGWNLFVRKIYNTVD